MKKELIELIDNEIKFCSHNYKSCDVSEKQKEWFIKGLEQSKHIIENYYELISQ